MDNDTDELVKPILQRKTSVDVKLKNYTKWRAVKNTGSVISRFLPMKLPYDGAPVEDAHNIKNIKEEYPKLGLVLDLQNQTGAYSVENTSVIRKSIAHESKIVPSYEIVKGFCDAANDWWSVPENKDTLIAVHCHYGFNRTGFLLCSYLIQEEGWETEAAIQAFQISKPPGIKHEHFKEELRRRYGNKAQGTASFLVRLLTVIIVSSVVCSIISPRLRR